MAKKTHIESEVNNIQKVDRDELSQLIVDTANKANKDGCKVAYFLDSDESHTVTDWVSTGSTKLDLAISNRPNGGLPISKVCSISGESQSGKSLLCAHIAKHTQDKGGVVVYIDTEADDEKRGLLEAIGVKIKDMCYLQLTTVEEIFQLVENMIGTIRKSSKNRLVTFIIDSIAAASDIKEMESEHGVSGYNTAKALVVSKALRKLTNLIARERILLIVTNQYRMNLNASLFQEKTIEPCSKALTFHSTVKVKLASKGKLKDSNKNVFGYTCLATVIKNRVGPPHKSAEFDVLFDSGIQDLASWFDFLKGEEKGTFTLPSGEKIKAKEFADRVNNDKAFKDEMYKLMCDKYITKYRDPNSTIVENLIPETGEEESEVKSKDVGEDA